MNRHPLFVGAIRAVDQKFSKRLYHLVQQQQSASLVHSRRATTTSNPAILKESKMSRNQTDADVSMSRQISDITVAEWKN